MSINLITTSLGIHHGQVEWDQLSDIIANFAHFDTNKINLKNNLFTTRESIEDELNNLDTYLKTINEDDHNVIDQIIRQFPEDESIESLILRLSKQGVLNFTELNLLAQILEKGLFLKQSFKHLDLPLMQYYKDLDPQYFGRKFLREFRFLVDPDGQIHLERHPELRELTKSLRDLEERIRRYIQEWLNQPHNQKVLQFNSFDVHYDRYVVPVRSDSYRSDLGMIISRSDSGQTLFVELTATREMCNRRMEINAKIDEIINQLTIKYSNLLYVLKDDLKIIHEHFQTLDYYFAKMAFSHRYHLSRPVLKASPGFKLIDLFHPLIEKPVKNDVICEKNHHGIVISGPNTGGKTVFLKSIALSYLLLYHGHYVPALEAEMFPYEGLFYFGNDLQDLNVGLSSFSGEVKNYIKLIENISPSNLILIDEIFNSTSSDEASALSLAYFNELHKRATCHIVVSTHHQMFKTLIHQDRHYISCHVGFDTNRMKPTYKIQWGTPGASMAIDIFRILANENELVKNVPAEAIKHINTKNISYETLLQKVSQKQIELDHLITQNRQLEVELKNQKGAMEGVLNLKLQDELSKARKEVDKIIKRAHELVEQVKNQTITRPKKVEEVNFELKQQLSKFSPKAQPVIDETPRGELDINQLEVGDTVYSYVLKKDVLVSAIDLKKKEVTVAKGPIKIKVPISTLRQSQHRPIKRVQVSFEKNHNPQFELDVRGMRLSEFQAKIELALGDLLTGDIPFLNVIHGHGDGVLKNWLRDYIKKSKDFVGGSPDNGNDGETRITLK
ncbi:MAG TPA: Smr/MutS family protein [Bacteriovoracaceae bacterium]|nr:Smr/MutS family protein [Bacteriovoracaceae bacterium]